MDGQSRDRRLDLHHDERHAENDLIRWMRLGIEAIRPHLTTILAVVAALLVLWGYFAWRRASNDARQTAAWNEFFAEDYETVISKYQDSEAAPHARMRIASNALQEGKSLLLSKRSEAIKPSRKRSSNSTPSQPTPLRRSTCGAAQRI